MGSMAEMASNADRDIIIILISKYVKLNGGQRKMKSWSNYMEKWEINGQESPDSYLDGQTILSKIVFILNSEKEWEL